MAYPATPKTWVAGDVLTAAQMNAELRDALLGAFPLSVNAWTGFTPTLTQSATVTKTVTYAKYQRIGRLIVAQFELAITGAGTASNDIIVGLPVAAAISSMIIGAGRLFDTSATLFYPFMVELASTTTASFRPTNTTAPGFLGTNQFTAALASGDGIRFNAIYEAAT